LNETFVTLGTCGLLEKEKEFKFKFIFYFGQVLIFYLYLRICQWRGPIVDLYTQTRERIENSQAVSLIDSHVKATCESSDRLHQVLWTALQCTVATPLHRPTMKEVVKALQAVAPVT
jgi:hypothetical protein